MVIQARVDVALAARLRRDGMVAPHAGATTDH
jgi:hypothetical protein